MSRRLAINTTGISARHRYRPMPRTKIVPVTSQLKHEEPRSDANQLHSA
jgi:hypothetical protein